MTPRMPAALKRGRAADPSGPQHAQRAQHGTAWHGMHSAPTWLSIASTSSSSSSSYSTQCRLQGGKMRKQEKSGSAAASCACSLLSTVCAAAKRLAMVPHRAHRPFEVAQGAERRWEARQLQPPAPLTRCPRRVSLGRSTTAPAHPPLRPKTPPAAGPRPAAARPPPPPRALAWRRRGPRPPQPPPLQGRLPAPLPPVSGSAAPPPRP